MIHVDLLFLLVYLFSAFCVGIFIGAWRYGRAVQRDAFKEKEWILVNTVFKTTFMAELRALEADAVGTLTLARATGIGSSRPYWEGKLQAFRDVIVKLGGKIYGKETKGFRLGTS